jgi:hypothetical protein
VGDGQRRDAALRCRDLIGEPGDLLQRLPERVPGLDQLSRRIHLDELGLELGERAAVTHEEPVEQEATRRVGQRLEHSVVVHAGKYVTRRSHVRLMRSLCSPIG